MGSKNEESLLDVIQFDTHLIEKQKSRNRWKNNKRDKDRKYRKHQFDDDFDDYGFSGNSCNNYDEDGWS